MKTRFDLSKLLRDRLLISCSVLLLIAAIVITSVFLIPGNQLPVSENTPESMHSSTGVSVNVPTSGSDDNSGSSTEQTTTPSDIVIDVGGNTTTGKGSSTKTPAKAGEKPVTQSTTSKPKPGGIVIGGGGTTSSKYDCHTANHHCDSPETHAFILNLELEGCPYCGSHSCPSFYGTDEWGNAGYFPNLCPKYDIKKDPVYYCQVCGRKNGNGDNNTCQKYIVDTICPICGKLVKANECHTH